jgi:uridylate kinase
MDILMKATRVDGVYSDDPEKNPHAVRYEKLTYDQVFAQKLRVMDLSAVERCSRKRLPILVFDYHREGAVQRAIAGQPIGTLICE